MSSLLRQKLNQEIGGLAESYAHVLLSNGTEYLGQIKGINPDTLDVCIADVKTADGNFYHRIIISGRHLIELRLAEAPFDLGGLADELKKALGPSSVKYLEDVGVITILDKIRVSEEGVEGRDGPLKRRIEDIHAAYMAKHDGGD